MTIEFVRSNDHRTIVGLVVNIHTIVIQKRTIRMKFEAQCSHSCKVTNLEEIVQIG